jgi:hypothetical protein
VRNTVGTPFVGYISLTSGAPGPLAVPIYVPAGALSAYALGATEFVWITNFVASTNDPTAELVTIDDGAATPKTLASVYVASAQQMQPQTFMPGTVGCMKPGQGPRAKASSVTAAKTIEIVIVGYITRT